MKELRARRRGFTVTAMKTTSVLFAVLALALSVCGVRADEAADKAELVRVENATVAALVAHDAKALTTLLAADWRIVTADASVMTREALLKDLDAGTLKFESYKISDLDVRLFGDAAVVIGHGDSKMEWKGESIAGREIFTDVFIRRDGKWLCVSSHSCDLPEPDSK